MIGDGSVPFYLRRPQSRIRINMRAHIGFCGRCFFRKISYIISVDNILIFIPHPNHLVTQYLVGMHWKNLLWQIWNLEARCGPCSCAASRVSSAAHIKKAAARLIIIKVKLAIIIRNLLLIIWSWHIDGDFGLIFNIWKVIYVFTVLIGHHIFKFNIWVI